MDGRCLRGWLRRWQLEYLAEKAAYEVVRSLFGFLLGMPMYKQSGYDPGQLSSLAGANDTYHLRDIRG